MRQLAIENLQEAQKKSAKYYNKGRKTANYELGQQVWLFTPAVGKGKSKKLTAKWQGPYSIVERINDLNYSIIPTSNPNANPIIVHVIRLKNFIRGKEPNGIPIEFLDHQGKKIVFDADLSKETFLDEMDDQVEIDQIIDHQIRRRKMHYLVHFKHHSKTQNAWVKTDEITAPDLIAQYWRALRSSEEQELREYIRRQQLKKFVGSNFSLWWKEAQIITMIVDDPYSGGGMMLRNKVDVQNMM